MISAITTPFCKLPGSKYRCNLFSIKQRIPISSPADILKQKQEIIDTVHKFGYVILSQKNIETTDLGFQMICEHFGHIQNRQGAKNGISRVVSKCSNIKTDALISNVKLFPHTDGVYLDGISNNTGEIRRIVPPKYVILECITPADIGGETILIDGKELLQSIINIKPLVKTLFARELTFFRREFSVNRVPVFQKTKKNRFTIRYCYDDEMAAPKAMLRCLNQFNNEFVLNSKYHTSCKLKKGDVLIVDNKRMLHGRTEFDGERDLRKAWINDDDLSIPLKYASTPDGTFFQESEKTSLKALDNIFYPLPRLIKTSPLPISTGISLNE